MTAFEFLILKHGKYNWPILKGKTRGKGKDMVLVRFVEEDSPNRYIFNEKVMSLERWNKAANLHNSRKARRKWK